MGSQSLAPTAVGLVAEPAKKKAKPATAGAGFTSPPRKRRPRSGGVYTPGSLPVSPLTQSLRKRARSNLRVDLGEAAGAVYGTAAGGPAWKTCDPQRILDEEEDIKQRLNGIFVFGCLSAGSDMQHASMVHF